MNLPTKALTNAVNELLIGGIVAYPTEAVWGLGCDPFNRHAVQQILSIKKRPEEKGMILVAANMSQLAPLLSALDDDQLKTLERSWPGPTTWVVEDHNDIYPTWVKGEHSSIAVRVTDHPVVKRLCEAFGGPVVSTSANTSGMSPALSEEQAVEYFACQVGCYLSGALGGNSSPSKIYSLSTGKLLR